MQISYSRKTGINAIKQAILMAYGKTHKMAYIDTIKESIFMLYGKSYKMTDIYAIKQNILMAYDKAYEMTDINLNVIYLQKENNYICHIERWQL